LSTSWLCTQNGRRRLLHVYRGDKATLQLSFHSRYNAARVESAFRQRQRPHHARHGDSAFYRQLAVSAQGQRCHLVAGPNVGARLLPVVRQNHRVHEPGSTSLRPICWGLAGLLTSSATRRGPTPR
jgi:hypothetical protein